MQICSRIQIYHRIQLFSRMASANQGKLGPKPFWSSQHYWPTKAQILLYKIICVKTNMKKHNEKKQEIAGSVNSRNCVKERKSKLKEMTNTIGNTWTNKIETRSRTEQGYSTTAETKWEWKKEKIEDSGASTEGPEYHQLVPSQYKGGGPMVKGIQRVWFGGGRNRGLYLVSNRDFFWEYTLLGWYLTQKR